MLKKIFLKFIFLCLLVSISYSQRVNFDQLKKNVLEAQTQREKAEAMMALGGAFSPREADQLFKFADSVLFLSENEDVQFYKNASAYLEALGHYKKGALLKALKLFQESLSYFSSQDDETKFKCLNFIGIIYLRTNSPDSAVMVFTEILQTADIDNVSVRLSAHGNLGRAYRQVGNYEEAINNLEQCVRLDSANRFSQLNSYMNIASMFVDMEFYDKGIEMLKHVDIADLPPQPIVAAYFNNLGEMYFKYNQYDSAIKYLSKGFETARSVGQNQQTLKNRMILSEIYLKGNNMDSSLSLLKAVKSDLHFYPAPTVLMDFNLKYANYFLKYKAYDSTIQYAKNVLRIAITNKLQHQIRNSHALIAEAFEGKGITDSTAYYYKQHAEWLDTNSSSSKEKFAQDAKTRYLLAQKEKQIKEEQDEAYALKFWQKWLIVLLVILSIIAIILFKRFNKSKTEVRKQVSENEILTKAIEKNKSELIELKSRAILPIDDIISIKVDGHYLEFSLVSKSTPEVDRNQIKAILSSLPSKFVQIHRSFVVNVDHIKIKQATKVILKDGSELPVSRTFKDSLNGAMNLD